MRTQINARNRAYQFDTAHGEKILFAGLRQGIDLPYECASGTCGTCKAKLIEGKIDDAWHQAPGRKYLKADQGEFLMCQCAAQGNVTVEVSNFVYASDPGACPARAMVGAITDVRNLTIE